LASPYAFARVAPNVGVAGIPDPRLRALAEMNSSAKIVPATVRFVDIAGLVKGASEGQGLGNQFLAHIRETDAICQVIRVFDDPDVAHVDGRVSPGDDIETINTELVLADIQTVDRALPRLQKEARTAKDRAPLPPAPEPPGEVLHSGRTLFSAGIDTEPLRELQLLTAKPFLYVFNLDDDEIGDPAVKGRLRELVAPAEAVFVDAKTEA